MPGSLVSAGLAAWAAATVSLWWLMVAVPVGLLFMLGLYDLLRRRHSLPRNVSVLGHARFLLEDIRPELQQYFIERNYDGRPYDRDTRTVVCERAKGIRGEQAFGTERDVGAVGCEYDMALLTVAAMSVGALSANALRALNASPPSPARWASAASG